MNNVYARISLVAAAGAVGAIVQTLIIVGLSEMSVFQLIGLPFKIPFTLPYLYQRISWGGLWGLLFLIPFLPNAANTTRGLIFAAGPALASLLFFLPFHDDMGWFGLKMGWGWPVVVVIFALVWGYAAGNWLDRASGLLKAED
ncbi:MAG TPA: hypothetical protein VF678_10305 [bacterium]